jgi:predicted nucleotidyltransferase
MVTEEIRGIIKKFGKQLKANHLEFDALVLFGSHARGNPDRYSDLDIAVISSQFGKNRLEDRIKLMKISARIDTRIEPHPVSLKDWEEGWKELVFEIQRTGIKIPT